MSSTRPRRTWLGTEVDLHAVGRDAVLAGVFTALNVLAGTLDWRYLPLGLAFGAGIGAILHVLPAEPRPTDSRRGRIVVRGISGCIGGAWAGAGVAIVASGAFVDSSIEAPQLTDLGPNLLFGAATGAAWYVLWGAWETRHLVRG